MSDDGDLTVEIDGDSAAFEPGDEVRGTVTWTLPEPPRSAEVRLIWFTQGKGTQDVSTVEIQKLDEPLSAEEGREFAFTLPEGPYSFSGKLISLLWAIELVVQPGKLGRRAEITVAPGGTEVILSRGQTK